MNAAASGREQEAAGRFQTALGLSPLLARLLAARGWDETAALTEFLYPRLEHTHSPWLMLGMETAVARIARAIAGGESIRILGDYDADGTIATVILRQALQSLGARVSFQLPERLTEGYGLQLATIERAVAEGVTLAITVDGGIRDFGPLERARALGLDAIVTDHHLPAQVPGQPHEFALPPALAILNPHQPGCSYPDKGLCGSGVAFKLAQALLERSGKLDPATGAWPARLQSYLKLVALGTIADSVPLLGENRVFVRFGLQGLADPVNPGLRALLASALRPGSSAVTASDVGFRIAPRINAAGRMGRADQVVDLFFAAPARAAAVAQGLEALNLERQQVCESIQADIEALCAADPAYLEAPVLLVAGAGWHRGVLGIVASRLLERTAKPVLVASLVDGVAHGSGRAPAGIHLLQILESCRELFDRFGGHAQAVGFALPAERLPEFRTRLAELAGAAAAPAARPADEGFEIRFPELTWAAARELQRLEPCGEANREPLFRARGVSLAAAPTALKERHLKLVLEQDGTRHTALFWNLWRDGAYQTAPGRPRFEELRPGTRLDIVFRLEASSHPQYGDRLQLILSQFFVTPATASNSYRTAESSL